MNLKLRFGTREDAAACGVIIYEAFKSIADQHNFPRDFPSVKEGAEVAGMLLSNKGFYSVVAESDGPGGCAHGAFQQARVQGVVAE